MIDNNVEITYEIYVDDLYRGGVDNLNEAMHYVCQYMEEGKVEVFQVETKTTSIVELDVSL